MKTFAAALLALAAASLASAGVVTTPIFADQIVPRSSGDCFFGVSTPSGCGDHDERAASDPDSFRPDETRRDETRRDPMMVLFEHPLVEGEKGGLARPACAACRDFPSEPRGHGSVDSPWF
ncbi:hypothetical protein GGR56DRAFT_458759 [Xylariaceae sp. FL0804]|nr:hypothetical protein GGR56DRAFT_458759 [Xylariaceae sp. FL0804]